MLKSQQAHRSANLLTNKFNSTMVELKNTVTIPYSDILTIKQHCLLNNSDQQQRQKERSLLLQKSQDRIAKWPNTIYAIRKKKDQGRFEKFQADELQRRQNDEEEAIYQAGVKKQILEKANKQMYEDNDRVRTFQSKMLLTDIMQEREGQIEVQQQLKQIQQYRDQMHHETLLENLEIYDQNVLLKKQQLEERKKQVKQVLVEQHEEMKLKYIQKYQEEKIEGQLIKQQAINALENQKQIDQQKKKQLRDLQIEIKQNNQIQIEEKLKKQEEERLIDQKIVEYGKKKEEVKEMKKIREEEKLRNKLAERQRLIDIQIKQLEIREANRLNLLDKQLHEAEVKEENLQKMKQEYRNKLTKRIDESKRANQEIKLEKQIREKKEQEEFQKYWSERNLVLQQLEQDEIEKMKLKSKLQAQQQKEQIQIKQKQREEQFIKELEENEQRIAKIENEDNQYGSWAEKAATQWSNQGKNIIPLIKEIKGWKHQ